MPVIMFIIRLVAWPLVLAVMVYQKTLSPDHGLLKALYPFGYCKFYPSCSEYARLVLLRDGLVGIPKIVYRVVRCNPGSSGGLDYPYKDKVI